MGRRMGTEYAPGSTHNDHQSSAGATSSIRGNAGVVEVEKGLVDVGLRSVSEERVLFSSDLSVEEIF